MIWWGSGFILMWEGTIWNAGNFGRGLLCSTAPICLHLTATPMTCRHRCNVVEALKNWQHLSSKPAPPWKKHCSELPCPAVCIHLPTPQRFPPWVRRGLTHPYHMINTTVVQTWWGGLPTKNTQHRTTWPRSQRHKLQASLPAAIAPILTFGEALALELVWLVPPCRQTH